MNLYLPVINAEELDNQVPDAVSQLLYKMTNDWHRSPSFHAEHTG